MDAALTISSFRKATTLVYGTAAAFLSNLTVSAWRERPGRVPFRFDPILPVLRRFTSLLGSGREMTAGIVPDNGSNNFDLNLWRDRPFSRRRAGKGNPPNAR